MNKWSKYLRIQWNNFSIILKLMIIINNYSLIHINLIEFNIYPQLQIQDKIRQVLKEQWYHKIQGDHQEMNNIKVKQVNEE